MVSFSTTVRSDSGRNSWLVGSPAVRADMAAMQTFSATRALEVVSETSHNLELVRENMEIDTCLVAIEWLVNLVHQSVGFSGFPSRPSPATACHITGQ